MSRQVLAKGHTPIDLRNLFNQNFVEVYTRSSFSATNVKDQGATGDGESDDTAFIQYAIALAPEGTTVFFPAGTYMIKATGDDVHGEDGGIIINKSLSLVLDKAAILKAIPGAKANGQIIKIESTSEVDVVGGQLIGDWDNHVGVGENNDCIACENSSNIFIHGVKMSQPSGDCVGLYRRDAGVVKNVTVERCEMSDFRRFGLFWDGDYGLMVNNCYFHDAMSDFLYGGGINIEYHGALTGVNMRNINVANCRFENIGDTTHSNNGALTASSATGLIYGLRCTNNDILNCARGFDMHYVKDFLYYGNTLTDIPGHPIAYHGLATDESCDGSIIENRFNNTGHISLGDGTAETSDSYFIKGIVLENNRFNNMIGLCIKQVWATVTKPTIRNNIFEASLSHYEFAQGTITGLIEAGNIDL